MRIVINTTNRPLKIRLPQGRVLHLGPRKEGQVTPQALESASVKKLVEAGDLEILSDDAHLESRSRRRRQRGPGHARSSPAHDDSKKRRSLAISKRPGYDAAAAPGGQ